MIEDSVPGSFRDPSGYVYLKEEQIYRIINKSYQNNYDHLIDSGLYEKLVKKNFLIEHNETVFSNKKFPDAYKNIKPENIPFVSYPYEWSFSQLKDAALLTIDIQLLSLKNDMTLKDASAYNIQFKDGKAIFIDTLSFEKYEKGKPWVAYQQFCQHFLAPLALMSKKDIQLSKLLTTYIDGIPLDLASKLLPLKTLLSFGLLSHIHLHASFQKRYSNKNKATTKIKGIKKEAIINVCENLKSLIKKLEWKPLGTEWASYYQDNNNYESETMRSKEQFVSQHFEAISPNLVWDLGANTGNFSRLCSSKSALTISFDVDPACVEINYLDMRDKNEEFLLPLLLDLTNPSPSIGWSNDERQSIYQRKNPQLILALALIHHLVISNNIPLLKIAKLFSKISRHLIIEFVPKNDSQVKKLLSSREDVFHDYSKETFEKVFGKFYQITASKQILNSQRTIYCMERLGDG